MPNQNLLHIVLAYQFTRNMKYLGPKESIVIKNQRKNKPIIHHHIDAVSKMLEGYEIKNNIVVGFEADKILKTFKNMVDYSFVLDYKSVNHGKIIKDILLKYNKSKTNYQGCFISVDAAFIPKIKNINIDPNKNYVFYTNKEVMESNITCNIEDNNVTYMLYNTTNNFWTGMVYLSNEAIRLIKHINQVYNTDPLFLIEVLNQSISSGLKLEGYQLKKKDFTYIDNNSLKPKAKVV